MEYIQPWPHLSHRDPTTGIPMMPSPLQVRECHHVSRHIGDHNSGPIETMVILEVRTWGLCSVEGDKALDAHLRLAKAILANAHAVSPWDPKSKFMRIDDEMEHVDGVYIEAVIAIPGNRLSELASSLDKELFLALLPAWVAWNLADPGITAPFKNRVKLLGVACDLVVEGVEWRSALSMAELEVSSQ